MNRSDFHFFEPLRVRYSEIDGQGVVFNAHYLTYFDVALNEYLRWIDFNYHTMVKEDGIDFHLIKSTVEYLAPIHFDEDIDIGVRPLKIGNSSLTWQLAIFRKNQTPCLAIGEIIWVASKIGTHQSHPLPNSLIDRIQANS